VLFTGSDLGVSGEAAASALANHLGDLLRDPADHVLVHAVLPLAHQGLA